MLTLDGGLVLAVVAATMVAFVSQKLRVDVVALCSLSALLVLGLISSEQALRGLSNPATVTVAAMFVLSAGLVRTGLVEWLGRLLDRAAGRTHHRLLGVMCGTIALLSAIVVNTAIVAIFIPIAIALGSARRLPPSQVLIPVSFASQFGGVCTLIGTSTNILVASIAVENGLGEFGLLEFAPLGLLMCAAGILYLVWVAPRLLPERKGESDTVDRFHLADYLAEFGIPEDSPLVGKRWKEARPEELADLVLIKLLRGDRERGTSRSARLAAGDILLLHGPVDRLMKLKDQLGLETRDASFLEEGRVNADKLELVEALVPPRSRLVARRLGAANLRRRFGATALAVQRRGRVVRERLDDVRLAQSDTLLLRCDRDGLEQMLQSRDLIVTNELNNLHVRSERRWIALGILILVVGLAAFSVLPIVAAALMGALAMVLSGCLTPEEAYESVDWKVILLLAGILPLGFALRDTGAAAWVANSALGPIAAIGPLPVLAGLYLLTAVLTETMSNNAAAVLLAPIAISLAGALGADPRPFLVAITFAASTSFATPIGYQTNTMIYGPGGYRFSDFARVGTPLNLLFWAMAVALIPLFWAF